LNGTYDEIVAVEGVPISMKYYRDYKLVMKGDYSEGYLSDLMTVDSTGEIIKHLPIVTWTNVNKIASLDTLEFQIKNVDSLTYYQYFYATTISKFTLGENTIKKQKPIHIKNHPSIKIPANELKDGDTLFLKCGVLFMVRDSVTTTKHSWGYFINEFPLK